MTPRIPLIIAAAGAALVLAMPAAADTWGADQTRRSCASHPTSRTAPKRRGRPTWRGSSTSASDPVRDEGRDDDPAPEPVRDDRLRLDPSSISQPVAATVMGRDLDWQQIGIGFAGGVMLVLALLLALRVPRHRLPAH